MASLARFDGCTTMASLRHTTECDCAGAAQYLFLATPPPPPPPPPLPLPPSAPCTF